MKTKKRLNNIISKTKEITKLNTEKKAQNKK